MTYTTQWMTMFFMLSSGLLMGSILDTYRVLTIRFSLRGWVVSLIDLLYWIGSALLVFGLLFWSNWGELRFHIFAAVLIGYILYFRFLSKGVTRCIQWLVQMVEKVVLWTLHTLYLLIVHPLILLAQAICEIFLTLLKFGLASVTFILKPVNWLVGRLMNWLRPKIPTRLIEVSGRVKKRFSWLSKFKKKDDTDE